MAIHPTAEVHGSAVIHEGATIGPRVIVHEGVEIGEGCEIMASAVIGPWVKMGRLNRVHYYAIIGHEPQHVTIDPRIKSGVIIGDGNNFREHSSVHRSITVGQNTIIGNNNYLMATGHIAHDCVIGNHVIISNLGGVAGHVSIGDRAFVSGPVGIHQWVRVGRLAMVGGMTGVGQDVPPFMVVKGNAELSGLNVVGLRRAGVALETRQALKRAYRTLFRSGHVLRAALGELRAEWADKTMPAELQELVEFCSEKSRRGICRGPRIRGGAAEEPGDDE